MKTRRIKIPIYYGNFIIHIVEEEIDMKKIIERYDLETDGLYGGLTFEDRDKTGNTSYVMILRMDGIGRWNPGIIAHESLHLALNLFRNRGIDKIVEETDEALCYLHQWFVVETNKYLEQFEGE